MMLKGELGERIYKNYLDAKSMQRNRLSDPTCLGFGPWCSLFFRCRYSRLHFVLAKNEGPSHKGDYKTNIQSGFAPLI